jgi:hypothetical protein
MRDQFLQEFFASFFPPIDESQTAWLQKSASANGARCNSFWGNAPGERQVRFRKALKARNRIVKTKTALVALTLFRAFSAWVLQLPQPGPVTQAITTFRAVGAGTPSFDTPAEAGYFHSVRFAEVKRLLQQSQVKLHLLRRFVDVPLVTFFGHVLR